MFKRVVVWLLVALAGGGAATLAISTYCPGLWTQIDRKVTEVAGWTEEARQADPVGFVEYAGGKLRQDLETLQKTRRDLAAEIGGLAEKLRQQRALRDHARGLAEKFRTAYREATARQGFPVELCGGAYTAEQLKAQVSMLLAEAQGYEAAIAKLEEVRRRAETELETLTVRISQTESQLAALAAEKEVLKARQLTERGRLLLAQVESLMTENTQVIAANPVRSVQELIAAAEKSARPGTHEQAVEAFLAERPQESVARVTSGASGERGGNITEGNPQKSRAKTQAKPKNDAPPKTPVQPASTPRGVGGSQGSGRESGRGVTGQNPFLPRPADRVTDHEASRVRPRVTPTGFTQKPKPSDSPRTVDGAEPRFVAGPASEPPKASNASKPSKPIFQQF